MLKTGELAKNSSDIFALTKGNHSKRQPWNSLRWLIYIINLVDKTKIIFTHVQKITVVSHQGTSRIVDGNHFLYSCDPDV